MDRNRSNASPAPGSAKPQVTAFDPRDLVPEPIFCCDAEGRFVWMNNAAEKLTGHTTVQLLGQPFSMLIAPSKRRRLASFFIRRHRREEVESERDVPILTREGRTVWVGVRARRVRTLHGRVGYVACAHDLHNMVFEIERLKREALELEARAAEATAAARLKGDFLSAMSQEIRSPMDGVLGMTRLLLESNLDRDQRTFAEVIQSSGTQLLRLVSDILDFSRIEAGKIEIASLDFDVRVTLDGVCGALAGATATKGITLSRSVHHDVPSHLRGDPGRLRQVLGHLLERLVQGMDKGEVSVWATLIEETPHNVTLRFSASYAGHTPSVDLAELVRVFGNEGRSRRMDAEALGMAVSRQLVTLMGGQTGVESQARGGSIWFQVPFKRHEAEAPAAPPPEVQLEGLRVLVADPSVGMRMALTEMLAAWGCQADEAEDGEFALTLLRKAAAQGRPYRVGIVDMQLPGLDGEHLARAVRSDDTLDGTLLMALTAVGRRGDAATAQEIGYSAYLLKPFEPSHMRDALIEIVHRGLPSAEEQIDGIAPGIVTRHSVAETRRQRLRILVVEDDRVNQLVAMAALRRAGYQPETAGSASEAIQAHALHGFDLIFMDLELPDLDGIETTAEIYRMEEGRRRKTPVVGLTGHDQPEVHRRCRAIGMKDVLVKPLDLDALCAGIDRWTRPEVVREPLAEAAHETGETGVEDSEAEAGEAVEVLPAAEVPPTAAPEYSAEAVDALPDPGEVELSAMNADAAVAGAEMGGLPMVELSDQTPVLAPVPAADVVHLNEPALEAPAGAFPAPAAAGANLVPASAARIATLRPVGSSVDSHPEVGEPVFDEARLESSSMGNAELKSILVGTFLNHIRPRLKRLREVAAAGDARAVEFEAHGLKGMSATIGAVCCADAFARVERLGREKHLEPVGPMLDYAEIEVGRVEAVIEPRLRAA